MWAVCQHKRTLQEKGRVDEAEPSSWRRMRELLAAVDGMGSQKLNNIEGGVGSFDVCCGGGLDPLLESFDVPRWVLGLADRNVDLAVLRI